MASVDSKTILVYSARLRAIWMSSRVDWESVCRDVAAHVRSKDSHGKRELTDLLVDLQIRHTVPEGLLETALRVYSPEVIENMSGRPATRDLAGVNGNGSKLAPS